MAACDTVPFLGEHRLVVLEGPFSAGGAKRGRRRKTAEQAPEDLGPWGELVAYVDRMPPSTTLVIVDGSAGAAVEALGKMGEVRRFPVPGDKEVTGWVMRRAKAIGLKLDGAAAKLLAELIGPDTWMLASEMDKLSAYAAGAVVRENDVRALVSRAKEHKGWELADAVVEGQPQRAMRLVQEMLEDGAAWPVLLSTVAGRYRRIAIAKAMMNDGASGSAIATKTGQKPGRGLDRLLYQARRCSWPAIREAYARIIEAELDVKGRNVNERVALDLCIHDLATWARWGAGGARGSLRAGAAVPAR